MKDKKTHESFEVTELEDKDLDQVAGGMADSIGVDIACTDNKDCPNNSGNCLSGCQAHSFFRAAHINLPVRNRGRCPALAGDDFCAGQFLVAARVRLELNEMAVIGEREHRVAGQDHVSGPETGLFPFHFSRGELHAFDRAFAIFLEAEHPVEVTIMIHRRAPMIRHGFIAGVTPQLLRRELATCI